MNLRSTTHWDLIPAPLTTRVPLLVAGGHAHCISQSRKPERDDHWESIRYTESLTDTAPSSTTDADHLDQPSCFS